MDQVFHDSEESSSGCESGWTLYLDHSITIHDCSFQNKHNQDHDDNDNDGFQENDDDDDDDDDDMSMVSDASSGPPHYLQEHQEQDEDEENTMNGVFCDPILAFDHSRKRRKILEQKSFYDLQLQDLPAAASLDDTASSPFFSFSNKDIKVCNKEVLIEDDNSFDYSQGHSATYFEMV